MNAKENKTGIVSREWVPALKEIRPDLNAYKKARNDKLVREQKSKLHFSRTNARNYFDIGNNDTDQVEIASDLKLKKPKFKIGQFVHIKLQKPRNNLNEAVYGESFRSGDLRWQILPSEIDDIYYMDDNKVPYRYKIKGITGTTFQESKLMKSRYTEMVYEVKRVWEKRGDDYLIQFYGETKKNSGFYDRKNSPELSLVMDDYDSRHPP
jgi:hypothetical protein